MNMAMECSNKESSTMLTFLTKQKWSLLVIIINRIELTA